jgi:hypothetical protein
MRFRPDYSRPKGPAALSASIAPLPITTAAMAPRMINDKAMTA